MQRSNGARVKGRGRICFRLKRNLLEVPCYPWLHALLVVCGCGEREAHASISVSRRASGRREKSSEPGSWKGGCGVWEQHVIFIVGTRPGWAHTSQVKSEAGNHSGKNAEKIRGEAQR